MCSQRSQFLPRHRLHCNTVCLPLSPMGTSQYADTCLRGYAVDVGSDDDGSTTTAKPRPAWCACTRTRPDRPRLCPRFQDGTDHINRATQTNMRSPNRLHAINIYASVPWSFVSDSSHSMYFDRRRVLLIFVQKCDINSDSLGSKRRIFSIATGGLHTLITMYVRICDGTAITLNALKPLADGLQYACLDGEVLGLRLLIVVSCVPPTPPSCIPPSSRTERKSEVIYSISESYFSVILEALV
jgi:hypothetical protein